MQYDPYSLADRLEKANLLTNEIISGVMLDGMSYADFKQTWKDLFSLYYQVLTEEAADIFEQACKYYDAERDGIENDPRKKFKPKTEFEIDQELKVYFEEQETLN